MADFERRQLEIGLEFVRWSFPERNNFSEGSSEPNKDAQVIRVRGAAAPRVFELELLVWVILQNGLRYQVPPHTIVDKSY